MQDKYVKMKNVRSEADFADRTGDLSFRHHSFGIGGVNPQPMPDKIVKGMSKLNPGLIRIFIQEFFFIEKENGDLDFTALDKYMRAIHATGADIMASVCIKPKSLYPVVDETIWKPNDIKRWQYIIAEMTKRYSVDNKYVTCWGVANEINIGEWGGCPYKINSAEDYFEYYKMTVEPILKVYPEARVGGPSWAGVPDEQGCKFFDEFIGSCVKENIQLDFISYNVYSDNPDNHINGALKIKDIVNKHNDGIDIYITELNVDLGGISLEERAYTPERAAGLGAIICDFHKCADFTKTFQYHIYDQFCDPDDFKPFYARARFMAEHWNDVSHKLGLFDEHGNPRPQYFVYKMLYSMAENEVAAEVKDCENVKIIASCNDRYNTVFLTNYNSQSAEDLTVSLYFKNAREGKTRMTVCRIDGDKNWDGDKLELIPVEDRTVYVHEDLHFSVYAPANSVIKITFDYDI